MTCTVCGADNEAGAAFCYRCGSALKPTAATTGPTVSLGGTSTQTEEPESGARVYDMPAQPSRPAPMDLGFAGSGTPTDMANAEPPVPAYNVPPQTAPTYTVPSAVGTVPQQSNGALISMILGITSLVLFTLLLCVLVSPLSAVAGIPAVILGRNARREIKASGGQITGDGMAVAGIVMGWINIGLSLLMLCGTIALIAARISAS